jgi:sodium/potassium-transporting ATPase subunit alpha
MLIYIYICISQLQKRSIDQTSENPLETKNLLLLGHIVAAGSASGVVTNIGDNTVMGCINKGIESFNAPHSSLVTREVNYLATQISIIGVCVMSLCLAVGLVRGESSATALTFVTGLIIALVPEGFKATIMASLSRASKRILTKGIMVKNSDAIQTLGSTTVICTDDDHVLTTANYSVTQYSIEGKLVDLTQGLSYKAEETSPTLSKLIRAAALCNQAVINVSEKDIASVSLLNSGATFTNVLLPSRGKKENFKIYGDSMDTALFKFCQERDEVATIRDKYPRTVSLPLNATTKVNISIHKQKLDISKGKSFHFITMRGEPEIILNKCNQILINGSPSDLTNEITRKILAFHDHMSSLGYRVVAFCEKDLDSLIYKENYQFDALSFNFPVGLSLREDDTNFKPHKYSSDKLVFLGLVAFSDPIRVDATVAVGKCKSAGVRVIMLSSNHLKKAKFVARGCGIITQPDALDLIERNTKDGLMEGRVGWSDPALADAIIISGHDINIDTPHAVWNDIFQHEEVVFCDMTSQQKLLVIEQCQRLGEVVTATGSSHLDVPALTRADVGISLAVSSSNAAKEAADMIVLDKRHLSAIIDTVSEGRLLFDNLKKSIVLTLSSIVPEILPFIALMVFGYPLPITSILLLCVDLGTNLILSISMTHEDPEDDIPSRKPRNSDVERLIKRRVFFFSFFHIGIFSAVAGFFSYFIVLESYGYPASTLMGLGSFDNFGKQVLLCL